MVVSKHTQNYQYFKNGSEQTVNEEFPKNADQHEVSVNVIDLCHIEMNLNILNKCVYYN